jgi:putative oxidoreductase
MLPARLLMSSLFLWDGILQLRDPVGTLKFFATVHVPAPNVAVWFSIPTHLLGGLAPLLFAALHIKRMMDTIKR